MEHPQRVKRFCKHCREHHEMKVSEAKERGRNRARPNSRFTERRMKKRGVNRGAGNKGKFSKPPISAWRGTGRKRSDKSDLRFECTECGKITVQQNSFRTTDLRIV